LLSAIPINYLVSWVGYIKKSEEKYRYECEEMRDKYCNELENLLLKCRIAQLSKRDTEISVMYYYQHRTPKEIWVWLCENRDYETIEWDSVYKTLHRIGKKLGFV
jgi:DNA-directed RNA polymerase specialized sigma subunit